MLVSQSRTCVWKIEVPGPPHHSHHDVTIIVVNVVPILPSSGVPNKPPIPQHRENGQKEGQAKEYPQFRSI
jgi:hypothetical protein